MEDIWQEDDGWYYISEPLISKSGPHATKAHAHANLCAHSFAQYDKNPYNDFTHFINMLERSHTSYSFVPKKAMYIVDIVGAEFMFSMTTGELLTVVE